MDNEEIVRLENSQVRGKFMKQTMINQKRKEFKEKLRKELCVKYHFNSFPETETQLRTLAVTCRRSQASALKVLLEKYDYFLYNEPIDVVDEMLQMDTSDVAEEYKDEKVDIQSTAGNYYAQLRMARLIIQFESLWKLLQNGVRLERDILILDEIRGILDRMFSFNTNKEHLFANISTLIQIMKKSKLVIMTDADLECDSMVVTFLRHVYTPEERRLIRIDRYPPKPHSRQVIITYEEKVMLTQIKMALQEKKNIGINVATFAKGEQLQKWFDKMNADENSKAVGALLLYGNYWFQLSLMIVRSSGSISLQVFGGVGE